MTPLDLKTQPLPSNFRKNIYDISFTLPISQEQAFAWLLKKQTFTRGQLPPYKVEFLPKTNNPYMQQGDFTNHHGPLIQFAGIMSEVTNSYRRLDYFYGSYALSFRWIRPLCLEVWVDPYEAGSSVEMSKAIVKLRLTTGVHRMLNGLWSLLMKFFWPQFALNAKLIWYIKNIYHKMTIRKR